MKYPLHLGINKSFSRPPIVRDGCRSRDLRLRSDQQKESKRHFIARGGASVRDLSTSERRRCHTNLEPQRKTETMKPPSYGYIKVFSAAVLTALLSVCSGTGHSSFCQIWQADILKSEASVKVSRSYRGLWISEKCEIHPGPHFLLRRYHINRSGHFNLVRFHYLDPWCTSPSFSVIAVGNFVPSPEKASSSSASWVVPGGIELDYRLRRVTLVPFTEESVRRLSQSVNESCPGSVYAGWRTFKKYKVFSYEGRGVRRMNHRLDVGPTEIIDCMKGLDLNFDELQLMRLEHRAPVAFLNFRQQNNDLSPDTSERYHSYLFFGAKSSPKGSRPTYYLMPLVPAQVVHCSTCRAVAKSSSTSPPVLSAVYNTNPPPSGLRGQWISLRCEVRPYGLFLRRTFIFGEHTEKENHWQAQHSYYRDPNCQSPMFTLGARGVYHSGSTSNVVPDATEYDFHITEAYITPEDVQFANNLNGVFTCGSSNISWKVGRIGNLTRSGGCRELGIAVPSVELDLIRFEIRDPDFLFLYLGETTENQGRATSFQPPLVQCSRVDEVTDDYLLNFNELRPLPLKSGSNTILGLNIHLFGFILCCLVKHLYYLLNK